MTSCRARLLHWQRSILCPSLFFFLDVTSRGDWFYSLPLSLSRCASRGDMDGLLGLLANDIVIYADSGGKAPAARHPICGADRVARYLLGLVRKAPEDFRFRVALINGQPGMIFYRNGVSAVLLTLEMLDGQIWEIDLIANPDKVQGVPALN